MIFFLASLGKRKEQLRHELRFMWGKMYALNIHLKESNEQEKITFVNRTIWATPQASCDVIIIEIDAVLEYFSSSWPILSLRTSQFLKMRILKRKKKNSMLQTWFCENRIATCGIIALLRQPLWLFHFRWAGSHISLIRKTKIKKRKVTICLAPTNFSYFHSPPLSTLPELYHRFS